MSVYEQRFHVARKRYRCDDCGRSILPGDRYLRYTASPGSEFARSDKWAKGRFCGDCARNATEVRR